MTPLKTFVAISALLSPAGSFLLAQDKNEAKEFIYLRPTPKAHVEECRFTLERQTMGWSIVSVTIRGDTRMKVAAQYGPGDRLLAAEAVLTKGDRATKATVLVAGNQATVKRPEMADKKFGLSRGMIVTSAPDWSDIFLLCKKYDAKKAGVQSFPGLWIHPEQVPQSIPFSIERVGENEVTLSGKRHTLARFRIRIRGPQPYTAWADSGGTLIKLEPGGIVRQGWEKDDS